MVFRLINRENILGSLKIIRNKARVSIGGTMESIIMDNGPMERNKVMECGRLLMAIIILANGSKVEFRAKVYILH